MSDQTILTPAETASYLRIPTRKLADWRYQRVGPPFIKLGGIADAVGNRAPVRYRRADLDQWIDQQIVNCDPRTA